METPLSPAPESPWKLVFTIPNYSCESWGIRRRNKTSGKSCWGKPLTGMSEYYAKTLCNDANRGASCFGYEVISPIGEVFRFQAPSTPPAK